MPVCGNTISDGANKDDPSVGSGNPAGYSGEGSDDERDRHQAEQRAIQGTRIAFGPTAKLASCRERNTKQHANPPSGDYAPADAQQCGVICAKDWRMANREVFNAYSSSYLIVDDTVDDTRANAHQNNRDPLHRLHAQ